MSLWLNRQHYGVDDRTWSEYLEHRSSTGVVSTIKGKRELVRERQSYTRSIPHHFFFGQSLARTLEAPCLPIIPIRSSLSGRPRTNAAAPDRDENTCGHNLFFFSLSFFCSCFLKVPTGSVQRKGWQTCGDPSSFRLPDYDNKTTTATGWVGADGAKWRGNVAAERHAGRRPTEISRHHAAARCCLEKGGAPGRPRTTACARLIAGQSFSPKSLRDRRGGRFPTPLLTSWRDSRKGGRVASGGAERDTHPGRMPPTNKFRPRRRRRRRQKKKEEKNEAI